MPDASREGSNDAANDAANDASGAASKGPVEVERPHGTWSEAVAPIVRKFEVAAALGLEASWNATGAQATGALMKEMARLLDNEALEAIRTRDVVIETIRARNERLQAIGQDAAAGLRARDAEIARLRALLDRLGADPDAT